MIFYLNLEINLFKILNEINVIKLCKKIVSSQLYKIKLV